MTVASIFPGRPAAAGSSSRRRSSTSPGRSRGGAGGSSGRSSSARVSSSTCSGWGARRRDAASAECSTNPNALGLDAAFAALFLALAMPYLRERRCSRGGGARGGDHARADAVRAGWRADRRRLRRMPARASAMSDELDRRRASSGVATIAFKAAGPVLVGRRELPPRVQPYVELLAPVMLTALVVTQTFGGDEEIHVDARVVGVGAALRRDRAARAHHRRDGDRRAGDRARSSRRLGATRGRPPCQNTAAAAIASATRLASPITRIHCRKCRMATLSAEVPVDLRLAHSGGRSTANGSVTSSRRARKR